MGTLRTFLSSGLFLSLLIASPALADDPPSRVGRVSAVEGSVALRPAGGEWTESAVNNPVAQGTSARTPSNGRAVLRIGGETIALAVASEIDVARLDAEATQIVLRQGRIAVRIAPEEAARTVEIDVPRGAIWLSSPGDYDIAAVEGATPEPAAADLLPASDAAPTTLRHLSAEVTGYEALDNNGIWTTVAGYGAVWFPTTAPDDWAPYRYGRWRWIAPWGWSWIDDMAWGFAPSHYGRWTRFAENDAVDPGSPGAPRWGWVPGELGSDPAYAPALVAFLGTAGVGLSYADAVGAAVGWFPLAPGELYWPSYTRDSAAIARLNPAADIAASVDALGGEPPDSVVNGDYRNRRFASVVPRSVFLAGRPVAAALLQLPERRLQNAPLLAGSPLIAPAAPRQEGAAPRIARDIRTLARIVTKRIDKSVTRATVLARSSHWKASLASASPQSATHTRMRVVAAPARTVRPRVHLAAAQRQR